MRVQTKEKRVSVTDEEPLTLVGYRNGYKKGCRYGTIRGVLFGFILGVILTIIAMWG